MGMKEDLQQRFEILEQGGLISARVVEYCQRVLVLILEEKPDVEEEKMAMFMTHLAMAAQRTADGKEESPLGSEILEAVKAEAIYPKAAELSEKIMGVTEIEFPRTEQDFLKVHLCNLLV